MTTQELLTIIVLAILAQVALFVPVGFFRHWRIYRVLHDRVDDLEGHSAKTAFEANERAHTSGWNGWREFRVQRRVFEDQCQSICSFYLVSVDGGALPAFKPGQFLTFQLPIADPATGASKNVVRCYSLSDSPDADYYRVSIKRALPPTGIPDALPGVSSNHFHDCIREGDVLLAKAPGGHFYLDQNSDMNEPIVLVGGGIGITPMLSMLGASLQKNPAREVWLFYGVRNSTEQIMKPQLEKLAQTYANFHLHVCYSKPATGDTLGVDYQHQGHVDVTLLRLTLPLKPYQFYVCGPRVMMEALVPSLEQWGVPDHHIHFEAFGPASLSRAARKSPPSAPEPDASPVVAVTFEKSGKRLNWDGSSSFLLDFAEDHDIEVSSGCRAGGCGSCQTTISAGQVEYTEVPDFEPEPGKCLLCVARPKTDLILSA